MSNGRGSVWVVSWVLSGALSGCVGAERVGDPALTRRYQELQLCSARLRQLAIQLAIVAYRIDASRVRDGVNYSPHGAMQGREGGTVRDRDGRIRVTLGDDAFSSAAILGSTIGHEVEVHVNRQVEKGVDYPESDSQGTSVQEVEAYDYELQNKDRFGLSEDDIRTLHLRRRTHYQRLQEQNRRRVDEGVYRKW
jgi:hypothetical protein